MGLTRAALTIIVNDLIERGLVREANDGLAVGGRRPIMLEINPQRGYLVGIDMGATHLAIMLADFSARVIDEIEVALRIDQSPDICLKTVDHTLKMVLEKNQLDMADILTIGMGVPGPVIAKSGWVSAPPIMPGWDKYPIRDRVESWWNCPVSLNNDAELGALGEWAHGAGRNECNLAYIKVGSGVGAGLLLSGNIYRGASGCAGEIGHVTIQENGPICTCGNYGCLEAVAGGTAIAEKARAAVRSGRRTQLSSIEPVENIQARDVAHAARLGDLVSQQIITEAGGYLGIAIASLVNLFNPSMVVVGGGVSQVGDLLLEPIRKTVRERSLRSAAQAVQITAAVLGRRSSGMGAVVQALNTALDKLTESI